MTSRISGFGLYVITLERIGDSAFYGWTLNQSIIVKSGFASGNKSTMWKECDAKVIADLGNDVTSIGDAAFFGCIGLTGITIDNAKDSISGAPWGASDSVSITWTE